MGRRLIDSFFYIFIFSEHDRDSFLKHGNVQQDALPPSKQFNGNHSDSDVSGTYDDGKQDPEARV